MQAITEWLSDMQGMTLDELLERPQLVDQLVSYHFVPGAHMHMLPPAAYLHECTSGACAQVRLCVLYTHMHCACMRHQNVCMPCLAHAQA